MTSSTLTKYLLDDMENVILHFNDAVAIDTPDRTENNWWVSLPFSGDMNPSTFGRVASEIYKQYNTNTGYKVGKIKVLDKNTLKVQINFIKTVPNIGLDIL